MILTKKSIISFLFLMVLIIPSVLSSSLLLKPVSADEELVEGQIGLEEVKGVFGGSRAEQDPRGLVVNIINIVLGFLALIFFILAIYGGFQYMTAGGNREQTSKAIATLRSAVIGLVIVLAAWALTRFAIVMINRASRNMDTQFYPQATL